MDLLGFHAVRSQSLFLWLGFASGGYAFQGKRSNLEAYDQGTEYGMVRFWDDFGTSPSTNGPIAGEDAALYGPTIQKYLFTKAFENRVRSVMPKLVAVPHIEGREKCRFMRRSREH
ncbi:hypothetical protein SODALDRAFT_352979 [Sodiomyces alkalinus F11]|uniref:Uncharacterized protein n=1 Tax=Sodiomyces alkalinus (strain CBS 110278 / VKM F-3762 / F11) TaxID=1314773 RepID=A0A3N2PNV1_SODAK|nr:hypothetical protein SODALDRAFT_352979 [Sodiomyces alkalinus F11]ROT36182.1 hypothetical protein SODALDRAFT_352979 [Sodiomyces alkalinus F11]